MMNLRTFILAGSFLFSIASVAQQHTPVVKNGSRYIIQFADQYLEVEPEKGGRITALVMGTEKFLTDSTVNDFNWGSTFWPSPQSDWNWPPPAEWDNLPYSVEVKDNVVKMTGRSDPKTGLAVTKLFSGDRSSKLYTLTYVITNYSKSAQNIAPWEVTRVHTGGFSFFPIGNGDKRGGLVSSTAVRDGICWYIYNYDSIPSSGDTQLYADGSEGWFCQVNGNLMLMKRFPDMHLSEAAPHEGEVELYANKSIPAKNYVEVEHQGAYTTLQPGQSLTWRMQWFFRAIPVNIQAVPFNAKLVAYARGLSKQ